MALREELFPSGLRCYAIILLQTLPKIQGLWSGLVENINETSNPISFSGLSLLFSKMFHQGADLAYLQTRIGEFFLGFDIFGIFRVLVTQLYFFDC